MYIMNEKDIKIMLFKHLLKKEEQSIVVSEVTLGSSKYMNTKGAVRADIFHLNNHDISIYEIKSERDSLTRLPKQIEMYKKYANNVSVVIGSKFKNKINFLSDDIGIYTYNEKTITCIRKPKYKTISIDMYIDYWWSIELKKVFKGMKGSHSLSLDSGKQKLLSSLNNEQIKRLTIFRLKERYLRESETIKELILNKNLDTSFPKKVFDRHIQVTALKDIPFGVINNLLKLKNSQE